MARIDIMPTTAEDQANLEQAQEMARDIEKFIADNPDVLGVGKAGQALTKGDQPYCLKRFINLEPEAVIEGVEREANMQIDAHKIGIRVPRVLFAFEHDDGSQYLGMERIKGDSLKDIFEKRLALPEPFRFEVFWKKLEEMVKKMHSEGRDHRDLHEGNIMVEWETGLPVIIDFGLSGYSYGDADPYVKRDYPAPGHIKYFNSDDEELARIKKKMRLAIDIR